MLSAGWSWFSGALGDDGDDGAEDGAGDVVSLGEFAMERNLWEWLREYQRSIGGL